MFTDAGIFISQHEAIMVKLCCENLKKVDPVMVELASDF